MREVEEVAELPAPSLGTEDIGREDGATKVGGKWAIQEDMFDSMGGEVHAPKGAIL